MRPCTRYLPVVVALALGCSDAPLDARAATAALRATPDGVDIVTYGVDLARTSWNRRETALTPANVRPETFGRVAVADGVYDVMGSALFASNLPLRDARADVVFVATLHNQVYALDADDLGTLWRFDFDGLNASASEALRGCEPHARIGVMSTPTLSPDRAILYVVGRVATSDAPSDTWLQGYALSTRTGSVTARFRVGETLLADGVTRVPLTVEAPIGDRRARVTFASHTYVQRAALTLVEGTLYVATAGRCDAPDARGWLLGYNTAHLSEREGPVTVYVPTPDGGGGIGAVGGASSDGRSVYVAVGHGPVAMRHDTPASARSVANALVRLAPSLALDTRACFSVTTPGAPCAAAEGANLRDVFMPRDAELLAGESFGSAGPLLVPAALLPQNMGVDDGHPLAALGGRDGFFYLVDRARMGGVGPSPLRGDADIAGLVGAELYGRALFLHSPTGGIRAGAAYFEAPSGRYLYVTGHDEITARADAPRGLAALRLARVRDPTPAECAAQYRRIGYGGRSLPCATIWGDALRPGFELAWSGAGTLAPGAPFVSSDGHANGIVWVSHQGAGDTRGLLEAWTADAGPGIDRVAAPLYRSDRAPSDLLPHATASAGPIVANGRVYVTGDNVTAYGLLAPRALPPMSAREPPPCEPGVTWSTHGRPFVSRYCADCHGEYLDLALLRRRRLAIAETIVPASLVAPTMPLRGAPAPSRDEGARVAAWLRCGAPGVALRTPPIVAQYGCSASPRATSRGGLALMALALACVARRHSGLRRPAAPLSPPRASVRLPRPPRPSRPGSREQPPRKRPGR